MAETLSNRAELTQELRTRYPGFLDIKKPPSHPLIDKKIIACCVEDILEASEDIEVNIKPYPLLIFRGILATVTLARVEGEVIASKIEYQPPKVRGFNPRVRYTIYRPGWLATPGEDPIKIQITEFVRGKNQILDFYLYTRSVMAPDFCAIGSFPLNLAGQQKVVNKLGIG